MRYSYVCINHKIKYLMSSICHYLPEIKFSLVLMSFLLSNQINIGFGLIVIKLWQTDKSLSLFCCSLQFIRSMDHWHVGQLRIWWREVQLGSYRLILASRYTLEPQIHDQRVSVCKRDILLFFVRPPCQELIISMVLNIIFCICWMMLHWELGWKLFALLKRNFWNIFLSVAWQFTVTWFMFWAQAI